MYSSKWGILTKHKSSCVSQVTCQPAQRFCSSPTMILACGNLEGFQLLKMAHCFHQRTGVFQWVEECRTHLDRHYSFVTFQSLLEVVQVTEVAPVCFGEFKLLQNGDRSAASERWVIPFSCLALLLTVVFSFVALLLLLMLLMLLLLLLLISIFVISNPFISIVSKQDPSSALAVDAKNKYGTCQITYDLWS